MYIAAIAEVCGSLELRPTGPSAAFAFAFAFAPNSLLSNQHNARNVYTRRRPDPWSVRLNSSEIRCVALISCAELPMNSILPGIGCL